MQISSTLDDIDNGHMALPEFQRGYVWGREQVRGLFQLNVRMEYRGDIVVSRAVRHPTVQGCPLCLRGDAQADPMGPTSCMVMRGDWQFRSVAICLRHARPLVPLWTASNVVDRFDTASRLRDMCESILAGELDPDPEAVDNTTFGGMGAFASKSLTSIPYGRAEMQPKKPDRIRPSQQA